MDREIVGKLKNLALNRLFLSTEKLGYFDENDGRIVESLFHDANWNWTYKKERKVRYSFFTLSMLLLSKIKFGLDTANYDEKILHSLRWLNVHPTKHLTDMTYGGVLSKLLGRIIYKFPTGDISGLQPELINCLKGAIKSHDNQNNLILIPATILYEYTQSPEVYSWLKNVEECVCKSYNGKLGFVTGDIRYCYHQRLMYTIWGLIFSYSITKNAKALFTIENVLRLVWQERRDSIDNAFLGHPSFYFAKNHFGFHIPVSKFRSSQFLFECHQTFYANAVYLFNRLIGKDCSLDNAEKALNWIFGENRLKLDLTSVSKIDLPVRMMRRDGNFHIRGEQYKGSYEVGSYIFALQAFEYFRCKDVDQKCKF